MQQQVLDFHKKYNCGWAEQPRMVPPEVLLLRGRLIVEEAAEFLAAASNQNMPEMADALADLLYVIFGAAIWLGVDLEPIFNAVHAANMTKIGGNDIGGKIQKGKEFKPPNIHEELFKQGWYPQCSNQ